MDGDRPPKVVQTLRGLSFSASAARALAFLPTSFRPYPTIGNMGDGQLFKSYALDDQMSKSSCAKAFASLSRTTPLTAGFAGKGGILPLV